MDNDFQTGKILKILTGENFQREIEPFQKIEISEEGKRLSESTDKELFLFKRTSSEVGEENSFVGYQKEKAAGKLVTPPYSPSPPAEIVKLKPPKTIKVED